MLLLTASLTLAADGKAAFDRGEAEVAVGSAFYQVAGYSRGVKDSFGANLNGDFRKQLWRGLFVGLHAAAHYTTYDQRRQREWTARMEPRIGWGVRLSPSTRLDPALGFSVDVTSGGLAPGPVVSLGLRQWLGRSNWFVSVEPRWGVLIWGGTTLALCSSYCNQTHNYNAGGSGILWSVGASLPNEHAEGGGKR